MWTRHSWRRITRLTILTARAWLGLCAFDVRRAAGFSRMHARLRRCAPRPRHKTRLAPEDIAWAVEEACVWYVRRTPCLQRSVVATQLLRSHGFEAELVIGYRPLPFESHAWVEIDRRVVNDRPQYQKFFTVLERL